MQCFWRRCGHPVRILEIRQGLNFQFWENRAGNIFAGSASMTRSSSMSDDEKKTDSRSTNDGTPSAANSRSTGDGETGSNDPSAGSSDETTIDPIAINVLMHEKRHFPPPPGFSEKAHIKSMAQYEEIYQRSVDDPEGFWGEMAEEHLDWYRKWDKVLEYDFNKPEIAWFIGGQLNVSYNCLDRHLKTWRRNKAALICCLLYTSDA